MAIDPEIRDEYEGFLNPDILRPRLLSAAIFIASFESLKDAIVSNVKGLFSIGFDAEGRKFSPEYKTKILVRDKSPVRASLLWYRENGAIDDADLDTYDRVRRCRNQLAHELLRSVAAKGLPEDFDTLFGELVSLLRKIEVWWVLNFELPTDPDWDGREVEADEVQPGRLINLQILLDVALGTETQSRYWYEGFKTRLQEMDGEHDEPG